MCLNYIVGFKVKFESRLETRVAHDLYYLFIYAAFVGLKI